MAQNKVASVVGIVGFTMLAGIIAFGLSAQLVPSPVEGETFYRPQSREVSFGPTEQLIFEAILPARLGQELDIYLPPLVVDESVDLQSLDIATQAQTEMATQDYARGLHMNCGGY
jgi:hypothetical protein